MQDSEQIPIVLSREDLYELAWSKPISELAKDFAISDVALAKRIDHRRDDNLFRTLDEWLTDVTGNGVFLRHDDFKWWLFLDTMVAEMLGGSRFSDYKAVYKKWFGVEPKRARA